MAEDREAVARHQSKKAKVGRKLEENVKFILNNILNKESIYIFSIKEIESGKSIDEPEKIIDFIKVRFPSDCDQQYRVDLPDTDLVVMYKKEDHVTEESKWIVLAIVSCKVSLHGRETESTFWAMTLQHHPMRMVFVTEDKDRYEKKTELGTCEKPTAARRRLETFMDRVYIIKEYGNGHGHNNIANDVAEFYNVFDKVQATGYRSPETTIFDDCDTKSHCGYCNKVKPLDDLISDIMMWKMERTQ